MARVNRPPTLAEMDKKLAGRKAKCWQCGGSVVDSSYALCGLEHRPDAEFDRYYCGCRGWN